MFSKLKSLHLERSVVSPFMAVAWNIILLFVIYTLCRVEYLLAPASALERERCIP